MVQKSTPRVAPRRRPASARSAGPAAPPTAVDTYHHGALRDALLKAAQEILLEGGIEAFSLRECARRAGVSHAAPAHHFGDTRGLLTAFAAVGFERMAERMALYRWRVEAQPAAQLTAVGQAYIDFALAHRAHFQLMHRHDRLDTSNAALTAASQRAGEMLSETLAEAMRAGGAPPETAPQRTALAWAAVHGFANLALEGMLDNAFGLSASGRSATSALGAAMLSVLEPSLSGAGPAPAKPETRAAARQRKR